MSFTVVANRSTEPWLQHPLSGSPFRRECTCHLPIRRSSAVEPLSSLAARQASCRAGPRSRHERELPRKLDGQGEHRRGPWARATGFMKVSTSGLHAWPARPVSDRAVADAYLIHHRRHPPRLPLVYGSPTAHADLRLGQSIRCSGKRVEGLMRSAPTYGPPGCWAPWAPSATPTTPAWPRVSSQYSPVVAHTARVRKGTRHTQGGADPTWRRQPHGGRWPTNVHSVAL